MATHPIHVPRKVYRGSKQGLREKAAEYNRTAERLEQYINRKFVEKGEDVQQFLYGFIASDLRLPEDLVREVLFGVEAGHNGLTVCRPGYRYTPEAPPPVSKPRDPLT